MDLLYTKIVGSYGFSPANFYDLLFKEADLIIQGHREQEKHVFYLMQIAYTNAIGSCFGGKKFKTIDPFKQEDGSSGSNKKKGREELLKELQQVKESFNKH